MRPIDADALYQTEKLLDTNIVRRDKVASELLEQILYDIQHFPTLAPPNEPLTIEQLREMDGEPVWFENMSGGRWCIVYADYHCLVGKMFGITFENAERTGIAYRRPPERKKED